MKKALPAFGTYCLLLLALLVIASSCNTSKILKPGEKLLKKNSINLKIPKKESNIRNLKYELSTLEKQKPNTNYLLFIQREVVYYNNSQPEDTTRLKRFWRRTIGEKPAIYDAQLAENTAESMQYYLNNKGFFDAKVNYKVTPVGRHKVKVVYTANTEQSYLLDTVVFISKDVKIQDILLATADQSELNRGRRVSSAAYEAEVSRIIKTLRNSGYFNFDRNSIDTLRGDSTGRMVNVYLEVFPPVGKDAHPVFKVGKVNVYPNYYPGDEKAKLPDLEVEGIHFRSKDSELTIKPPVVVRSIFLQTGQLYQRKNLDKTKLQLNRLNNFRAVSVIPLIDSLLENTVNFDIYLNPRKKLELGYDFEFNNSNYTVAQEGRSLLGTALGINYRNWNLFKNATLLNHKISGGIEIDLRQIDNPKNLIYSADGSYSIGLYLPKFVPWTGPYRLLNKITIGRDTTTNAPKKLLNNFYQQLRESAKTRITANLSIRDISTLFLENSYEATFGYEFQPNANHNFIINHTGLTFFYIPESSITPLYASILANNDFLRLSQNRQLFTGIFFRDFNYTYSGNVNNFGESWYLSNRIGLSGLEAWAANKIYNGLTNSIDTFQILNDFRFEQFFKLEIDLRYYRKFNENRNFAFRANIGIANPFGFSDQVPYVQQFYLGGGNSMRAWKIRELGPGAYCDNPDPLNPGNCLPPDASKNNTAYFQTGNFKLEFNAEYRFKLISNFDGAFFLDVGNIWSLDPNDTRGDLSQFNLISGINPNTGKQTEGFISQMAIGTGFGLRWDFSYFILRFDMGLKLRDPANKAWFPDWNRLQLSDLNPNLAIGYPF